VAVAVGAAALLVPAARAAIPHPSLAGTVRQQVAYVLAHRQPGDAVVVGPAASFAFGFYWPERPTFRPATASTAVRFQVDYQGRDDLVVVHQPPGWPGIVTGMRQAARSRSGRVWVVLAVASDRGPAWKRAMAGTGQVVRTAPPKLVQVRPWPSRSG
jgi:hypothetical protein